jgi:hypothetical protein
VARDVARVPEELRDDLAEAERDQGEVVAAEPQRRRADDQAEDRAQDARDGGS